MANQNVPILGVCMGHQLLASVHNFTVSYASQPMHGRMSTVRLCSLVGYKNFGREQYHPAANMLFNFAIGASSSSNNSFVVTRYHSLSVKINEKNTDESSIIVPLAYSIAPKTEDESAVEKDELMALAVLNKPWVGVQFHPESVGTALGKKILQNWCHFVTWFAMTKAATTASFHPHKERKLKNPFHWDQVPSDLLRRPMKDLDTEGKLSPSAPIYERNVEQMPPGRGKRSIQENIQMDALSLKLPHQLKYQILIHKIEGVLNGTNSFLLGQNASQVTAEQIFEAMYSNMSCSFWLDSSNSGSSTPTSTLPSRVSIMGAMDGPYSHFVEYFGAEISAEACDNTTNYHGKEVRVHYCGDSSPLIDTAFKSSYSFKTDILTYMQQALFPSDGPLVAQDDVYYITPVSGEDATSIDPTNCGSSIIFPVSEGTDLPFNYRGGYVGFLGYEVRHDTFRLLRDEISPLLPPPALSATMLDKHPTAVSSATTPDAAFIFSDRSLICDHVNGDVYLLGYALSPRFGHISSTPAMANLDAVSRSIISVTNWMKSVCGVISCLQEVNYGPSPLSRINTFDPPDDNYHPNVKPGTSENMINSSKDGLANKKKQVIPSTILEDQFVPCLSKELYTEKISKCHEYIRLGESYQLCLTNQMELDTSKIRVSRSTQQALDSDSLNNAHYDIGDTRQTNLFNDNFAVDPFIIYRDLRMFNPAPFAAFLRFDPSSKLPISSNTGLNLPSSFSRAFPTKTSIAICSSSPERFLSLAANGTLESKPIKGTCPRGVGSKHDEELSTALQRSEKNIAENLMIVDLIRNDLGRVCKVGSIGVPSFGALESFSSVHQLVSTIQGEMKNGYSAIDALIAAFPGGSMTGTPKKRTLELLHDLEERKPRGPYSGCIGYISPNNAMDMNIVIRTAVISPSPVMHNRGLKITVGAGGAITALSNEEDEYEEMLLKTRAVVSAVIRVLNRVAEGQIGKMKGSVSSSV
jgi:anthranilate/para-aminobenzoate synthase component I/anthranilate/para-aminobenzoate synthase component II